MTGLTVSETSHATTALRTAGQDLSHYAPRTHTVLVSRDDPASWPDTQDLRAGFLGFDKPLVPVMLEARLGEDPDTAARNLYAELHRLDAAGLDVILLESPPADPAWRGVEDRLQRAAAPRDA